jgi:hypothetical protein
MEQLFLDAAKYAEIDWHGSLPYYKLEKYNQYIIDHRSEYKKGED